MIPVTYEVTPVKTTKEVLGCNNSAPWNIYLGGSKSITARGSWHAITTSAETTPTVLPYAIVALFCLSWARNTCLCGKLNCLFSYIYRTMGSLVADFIFHAHMTFVRCLSN